jgi:hypothetical protein
MKLGRNVYRECWLLRNTALEVINTVLGAHTLYRNGSLKPLVNIIPTHSTVHYHTCPPLLVVVDHGVSFAKKVVSQRYVVIVGKLISPVCPAAVIGPPRDGCAGKVS